MRRALQGSGYKVVLYDNLSTGFRQLAQVSELVEGDTADDPMLRTALVRVEAVMHFAATPILESRSRTRESIFGIMFSPAELYAGRWYPPTRILLPCAVYGVP